MQLGLIYVHVEWPVVASAGGDKATNHGPAYLVPGPTLTELIHRSHGTRENWFLMRPISIRKSASVSLRYWNLATNNIALSLTHVAEVHPRPGPAARFITITHASFTPQLRTDHPKFHALRHPKINNTLVNDPVRSFTVDPIQDLVIIALEPPLRPRVVGAYPCTISG